MSHFYYQHFFNDKLLLEHVHDLAVHLAPGQFWLDESQGSFQATFILLAHSFLLKSYWWGEVVRSVAHVILVSAQVISVLTLDFGLGLDKRKGGMFGRACLNLSINFKIIKAQNIARTFLFKNQNNTVMRVLPDEEKLDFVRTSVFWISNNDIMDTCFILNYGYEAPLPWPQVSM